MENRILKIDSKQDEKFLRKKTEYFDFQKFSRKEIGELIRKMKEAMNKANGIGLSANQIGLDFRVFVAQARGYDRHGNPRSLSAAEQKFYAVFNPEIVKLSKEKEATEEGCLSVPGGIFGEVERPAKIIISGFDRNGRKMKIKAWGLLARIFQHEIDHLDGKLFIDRAKNLRKYEKVESTNK